MSSASSSQKQSSSSPHSIAFRVMRLCRPSFQLQTPLLLDPLDLFFGEDDHHHLTSSASSLLPLNLSNDLSYRNRFELTNPHDALGLSGMLVLPQAFGAIYLGETFCSYVSINNSSSFEVRGVVIKAEIITEKQQILLLDTSKAPVETIRSGGRYDFIVEHDVKELGLHTLVCTAIYDDGEQERKYLPQFFKFTVANPLSVRTKVRTIKENTFVEACIENHTKSNLFMDQVEFEPSQNWTAEMLKADDHYLENDSHKSEIFKPPILIKAGGGIFNYLYQLKSSLHGSSSMKVEGGNILGKLQITWRTNLGEPGRLQTQQILGSPITRKEIDLQIVEVPSVTILEKPFLVHLQITNQTERIMGPFEISLAQEGLQEENSVMINGLLKMVLPQINAFSSSDFNMNLIATSIGVQKIAGITVFDLKEKIMYEPLPNLEIFVESD